MSALPEVLNYVEIWHAATRDGMLDKSFRSESDAESCALVWRTVGLDALVFPEVVPS